MKKSLSLLLFTIALSHLHAQFEPQVSASATDGNTALTATANAAPFAATITAADMRSYLEVLASDEYEGRETGAEGQRKAADFIATYFEKWGLPQIGDDASYFQKISFTAENWDNGQIEITLNGDRYRHLVDFYAFPSANPNLDWLETAEVTFLGYGIEDPKYNDYKSANVKGKVILIHDGEPVNDKGISHLTGATALSDWATNWRRKLEVAKKHGVAAVLILDNDIKKSVGDLRSTLLSSEMKMGMGGQPDGKYPNNLFISSTIAREIVGGKMSKFTKLRDGIKASGKPAHLTFKADLKLMQKKTVRQLLGSNVLGFVEGVDPKLKHEVVVVTAHYDHLGKRGNSIYHGADDNASGTSAVMDIAQAFAEAKEKGVAPRRSVLCMLVSGEEKGLLGSEFYSEYPIFPLENTVANVNVDMIGRMDKKHESNPNYIYVIGADRLSTTLHDINEAANQAFTELELDYTYNAKNDPNRFYYRSDHYNFARKGIPAIFFFSGTHKDYHQPSDSVEKIDFEKMEKIARLVFYTTWELANREERIQVNVKQE